MARKSNKPQTDTRDEAPGVRAEEAATDLGLSGAINAAEGEQAEPETKIETPKIQPAGNFPRPEDAYADMSQPPPAPAPDRFSLDHGTSPPQVAFRVRPRQGNGHFIWMVNQPYGKAEPGESFTYSIAAFLREPFLKEVPALVPYRVEIRLVLEAGTSLRYSLLEVPADPPPTAKKENARQGLLRMIQRAEVEWTIGEKVAGHWGGVPAAHDGPVEWLQQSDKELSDLVYLPSMIWQMDHPIVMRYRKLIK
jgi:hypothetical protein